MNPNDPKLLFYNTRFDFAVWLPHIFQSTSKDKTIEVIDLTQKDEPPDATESKNKSPINSLSTKFECQICKKLYKSLKTLVCHSAKCKFN